MRAGEQRAEERDGARGAVVGTVAAVCLGPGGIPKHAVARATATEDGLAGDAHRFAGHGGRNRALCLISAAEVASLAADGVPVDGPGAFGENVLVDGLDLRTCAPGDRLRLGPGVVVELFDVREPCRTLRSLDARFPELMLGRSGFVARVLAGGELAPGMAVRPEGRAAAGAGPNATP